MIQKNEYYVEHFYSNGNLMYQIKCLNHKLMGNYLSPVYHGEAKGWYNNGLIQYNMFNNYDKLEGERIDYFF